MKGSVVFIVLVIIIIRKILEYLSQNRDKKLNDLMREENIEKYKQRNLRKKVKKAFKSAQKPLKEAEKKAFDIVDLKEEEEKDKELDKIRIERELSSSSSKGRDIPLDVESIENAFILKEIFLPPVSMREMEYRERFD